MAVNNITGNNINQITNLSNNKSGLVRSGQSNENKIDQDASNSPVPNPDKDNLTITESAARLKKLEDSIAHLPIVDMQRVEDVQKSIKDGSYKINPNNIAEKMIDMELALFAR